VAGLEDLPVAEVDGVALFLLAASIGILGGGIDDGAGIKDGHGGEANVDEEAVEFSGVAHKAVRIALFGVVEDIGSHKLKPGGRVREVGLVRSHAGEDSAIANNVELGGEIGRDEACRRSGGGDDVLGVVLINDRTDDGIRRRDDAIVVDDTAHQFIEDGGELLIGGLVDDEVGTVEDELRKTGAGSAGISAIDSHDRLGNDGAVDDLGEIGTGPAPTGGNQKKFGIIDGIGAGRRHDVIALRSHFFLYFS